MPFQSQAQRAWMYSNHPAMAKRWEAVTPKGKLPEHKMKNANAESESNETPNPRIAKLPRVEEKKRDFGPLHPSAQARIKTSKTASTKESDEEWGVEAHHGSRKGKMNLKDRTSGFAKRDSNQAARKKV
jgi:hypothetical protein